MATDRRRFVTTVVPAPLLAAVVGAGVLALGADPVIGAPAGTPSGVPFQGLEQLLANLDLSFTDLTMAIESGDAALAASLDRATAAIDRGTEATRPNLGPRRASDLVTLVNRGSSCATVGAAGGLLDRRVTADGHEVPFAVPAGKVLVVTGLTWRTTGNTAHAGATLRLEPPGSLATGFTDTQPALADGHGGNNATLGGLVVGAGVGLCLANSGDSAGAPSGLLYGYLADAE